MSDSTVRPAKPQPVYLMLRMKPPWVFIDEIRRFVESFCACAATGANRESQLATDRSPGRARGHRHAVDEYPRIGH